MPTGVPVATVALNGAKNAAILAVQILATSNQEIAKKLLDYKSELNKQVLEMVERIKS
jgi:5-(carboxyamino)imidazole ribonucleotide mutase